MGCNHPLRWIPVATVALLVAVVLAGCGSETKSDFVAQANAICASAVRAIRTVAAPSSGGSPSQQHHAFADYLNHAARIVTDETAQLRRLRRPQQNEPERATLTRYLAAMAGTVAGYRALASAVQSGDRQAVAQAESALAADPVASLAASYGLRSCATPGATDR